MFIETGGPLREESKRESWRAREKNGFWSLGGSEVEEAVGNQLLRAWTNSNARGGAGVPSAV